MNKQNLFLVCQEQISSKIKALLSLSTNPFLITEIGNSGNEALRKITQIIPDVVITDYSLLDMNGFDFAVKLEDLKICPTIILANPLQSDYIDELKKDSLNIFCITKPIKRQVLTHTIELAVRLSHKFHAIEKKISDLEIQIEERKNVDKARGFLMKKFNMDENTAYNSIRKKAMDSGRTINDIAKTIIKMFEKFNN
jgi:response regulator NasT